MIKKFFFDTYALIEIYKANPNYQQYKKETGVILNKLNLMEYAVFLFRENRGSEVKEIFEKLKRFHVDYDEDILIEAARMKQKYAKDKLSFIDCIGYLLSRRYGVKFLTGDSKFKKFGNVEFVK